MGYLILASLVVVPLAIWGLVNPQGQWRALSAWQYRNPDANEPSDAAYALSRFGSLISLVVWIVLLVMVADLNNDVDDPRQAAASHPTRTRPTSFLPKTTELGPLPIAGYHQEGAPSRLIGIIVHTPASNPWWCRPQARVLAETAQRVEVAAVLGVTPIGNDDPHTQCNRTATTPVSVSVRLNQPLGKRPLVTRGPFAGPAGKILPAGPVRQLRVVPSP